MPREERAARWRGMRAAIGETSAARWCQRFLAVLEQRPATPLAPPPPVLRARSLDGP
jgi:trehalose-6-phosphate synthase